MHAYIYCEMITPIKVINTLTQVAAILSVCMCMCVVNTYDCFLSKFRAHSTMVTIATMLYISSPELIHPAEVKL